MPIPPDTPNVFGLGEFLASLALMVLAWTIADERYRFRIRTAPLPLHELTFAVILSVGVLTLLTDLWRAEGWLVPRGPLLTPSVWQALLGASFLGTFFVWIWFAFIRPPTYGKRNVRRYAHALYRVILRGSPEELAVVADEVTRSMKALVLHAPLQKPGESSSSVWPDVAAYANDILLLIGDKRFCRAVVRGSPGTALVLFQEMAETKKYRIAVGPFARNVVDEAVLHRDSFLYHEAEGYRSGLLGYHRPLTQALFGNHELVSKLGAILDPPWPSSNQWKAEHWSAYSRAVLTTLRDYAKTGYDWNERFLFHSAFDRLGHSVLDLYKLNGAPNYSWDDDVQARLRVVIGFIEEAVKILDDAGLPEGLHLRIADDSLLHETVLDQLANLIAEVIFAAAAVRSPVDFCWSVQHNSVWGRLFNFNHLQGPAGRAIKFKVRRVLYDDIVELGDFPNFKGAKILAFCLNVMGLELKTEEYYRDSVALHRAVLSWTRKNYSKLHARNQEVAAACLVDGITYEAAQHQLVRTYPAGGLATQAQHIYLPVEPPPDVSP